MTPTERVENDVDRFIDEIVRIDSAHRLYLRLTEQWREDVDVMNTAHLFFRRVFEAIESEIIVSLSKLYEIGRSDRNLMKLVNYVRSNRTSVDWGYEEISHEQTDEHKQLIKEQQEVVENVISRRDKFYAHHDKEYFLNANDLTEDFPLDVDGVEALLEVAERIVGDYYRALTGSDMDMTGNIDVGRVFRALGEQYLRGNYSLAGRD
jgi:hypothetical protein